MMHLSDTSPTTACLPLAALFYSLQGEGRHTGRPAVFIRLAGCENACHWCDAKDTWSREGFPLVPVDDIVAGALAFPCRTAIVTGGEPLLHPLGRLCRALKEAGFRTHLETSGTATLSGSWDWICLSPKKQRLPLEGTFRLADELKVIVETEADFAWAEEAARRVSPHCSLLLQPEHSRRDALLAPIISYIKQHPRWNLSLQVHKILHIP
jgi:organic radical activating enzyme